MTSERNNHERRDHPIRGRAALRSRARTLLAALFLAAALAPPTAAPADPPNAPDIGAYTTNGPVWAIARSGGRTYIGGDFTRIGVRSGAGVSLSSGDGSREAFPEVAGGDVRAVVSDTSGGWYIGGTFTSVGGAPHVGLAHVRADGSVDPAFGAAATDFHGNPAEVDALAYDDGVLYLGGEFSLVASSGASESHTNLAAVNASSGKPITAWSPATSCAPQTGCSATVRALAVGHVPLAVGTETKEISVVFFGGDFNLAGTSDHSVPLLGAGAIWGANATDSGETSIAGALVKDPGGHLWAPPLGGAPAVRALQVQAPQAPTASLALYVGGSDGSSPLLGAYQFKISTPTSRSVDDTGSQFGFWTPNPQSCDPAGCDPSVDALALKGSTLYFAGDFSTLQQPPQQTTPTPALRVGEIATVPDPADTSAGTPTTATPLGGADGPVRAIAASNDGNVLYLAGEFTQRLAALTATGDAKGSPTAWTPKPDAPAYSLGTDASSSSVYAGGQFRALGSVGRTGLAAFGSSGTLLDWAPNLPPTSGTPLVRALAATESTVYVGGRFVLDPGGPHPHTNLAAVDSASGAPVDAFDPAPSGSSGAEPQVLSLALLGSTLYAGGTFDRIGGQDRRNLAALAADTGAASDWNPNVDDDVYSILPACGVVYVGGGFTHVGLPGHVQPRSYLAAFNPVDGAPTSWDPQPDGVVLTLGRSGATIYAGGNFSYIGGALRQRIAGLRVADGGVTDFDPAGNGPVRTLAASDTALYVGGVFTSVGEAARRNLAALDPATGQAAGWNPNVDGPVRALAIGDGDMFVAGDFAAVGSTAQRGFAPFSSGAGSALVPVSCAPPPPSIRDTGATPAASATPRIAPTRTSDRSPRLGRLTVGSTRIRLGRDQLTVRFSLSRAGKIRLRFERLTVGRCPVRRGSRTPRRRCARYVRFADVTGSAHGGASRLSFPRQRIGRRPLVPGRYRVTLTTLPIGPAVQERRAYFTVLAR